jgi:hypothetical protein
MRSVFPAAFAMVFFAVASAPLTAQQGTTSLSGTVLDASGQALPGAAIAVRNKAGGPPRTTNSDNEGRFTVADLAAGTYTVQASATGFSPSARTGVRLAGGTTEEVSITLNVGSLSQAVTVDAAPDSPAAQSAPSQTFQRTIPSPFRCPIPLIFRRQSRDHKGAVVIPSLRLGLRRARAQRID